LKYGFGKKIGIGNKPAVIVIDTQNYMLGIEGHDKEFPSSCGEYGRKAVNIISRVLGYTRKLGFPIIYTKFTISSERDMGAYGLKRQFMNTENWCLRNTKGAEISDSIKPRDGDIIIEKLKPSAFFGTPLLSFLINLGVDTVIIMGGATSNCVRATVFDASSFNFRTILVSDGVFDRIRVSHEISLFDMDRQFADVMSSDELIEELSVKFMI
jgi:nicotinamidase-related amidase